MATDDDGFTNAGDWSEIVGEMTRGGQNEMVGANTMAEVFGAMVRNNPAFAQQIARRVAASRPAVQNVAPVKARDWSLPFTVYGTVGQTASVTATPQVLFRAEKLIVTEIGSSTNGYGSTITAASVGQKNQLPATTGGQLSASFTNGSLGNGIKWDTCQPAMSISLTISFLQTCTWYGTLFGKAVL